MWNTVKVSWPFLAASRKPMSRSARSVGRQQAGADVDHRDHASALDSVSKIFIWSAVEVHVHHLGHVGMEALQRALRRFGVEGAGRHIVGDEVVEQRARHGRLADAALVRTDQNHRWLCHCPPLDARMRPRDALRPARKPDRRHGQIERRIAAYSRRAAVLHTPMPDRNCAICGGHRAVDGTSRSGPASVPQGPDRAADCRRRVRPAAGRQERLSVAGAAAVPAWSPHGPALAGWTVLVAAVASCARSASCGCRQRESGRDRGRRRT